MKTFFIALATVAALASVGANAESLVLNSDNFDAVVGDDSKDVFVKFHLPWCGHCKAFKPEWDKLSTMVDEDQITIAEMDATEFRSYATKFHVKSYPTLLLFKKGGDKEAPIRYISVRKKAADLLEWLKTGELPPSS